jgi:hypothetical protein
MVCLFAALLTPMVAMDIADTVIRYCHAQILQCTQSAACTFCFDVFEMPQLPDTDQMSVLMYNLEKGFKDDCDLSDTSMTALMLCSMNVISDKRAYLGAHASFLFQRCNRS